jgi:hypothetical protein
MSSTDAAADVERVVAAGGDADDVVRGTVAALAARYAWAGIFFVERDALVLGPEAGEAAPERRTQVPVSWQGRRIAELAVDGAPEGDRSSLERVAELIAAHCLVGWDTGGEAWSP